MKFLFVLWSVVTQFRNKIDNLIAKSTPHPDPDAPEDPESVRFWCRVGGTFSERERTSVSGQASASIAASSDALGALMSDPLSAPSSSTGTCGNGPALRSLVDVASAPIAAEGAPKAKAKAKTKAKAKAGAQQVVPKTPEEQRAAIRI